MNINMDYPKVSETLSNVRVMSHLLIDMAQKGSKWPKIMKIGSEITLKTHIINYFEKKLKYIKY